MWYYLYMCVGCTIAFGLFHRKVHEDFVLVLFQSPQGLCDICSFAALRQRRQAFGLEANLRSQ